MIVLLFISSSIHVCRGVAFCTSEWKLLMPEKVWQILTAIDDGPKWQSTVSTAHINGALAPGTTFTWPTAVAEE